MTLTVCAPAELPGSRSALWRYFWPCSLCMATLGSYSVDTMSSPDSIATSPGALSTSTTPLCGPMVSHAQHAPARQPNSKSSGGGRGAQGGSKRQGKATKPLPAPLTETILMQAMSELPDGTRRATETCYQCFQVQGSRIGCACLLRVCACLCVRPWTWARD
jgi:hypothetical protein